MAAQLSAEHCQAGQYSIMIAPEEELAISTLNRQLISVISWPAGAGWHRTLCAGADRGHNGSLACPARYRTNLVCDRNI
jgi:hypothetical protein